MTLTLSDLQINALNTGLLKCDFS